MSSTVLVVDDDEAFAYALAQRLRLDGHEVGTCSTAGEAVTEVRAATPSLLIIDYRLPDGTALDVLSEITDDTPALVITAFGTIDGAVEAMRRGCVDYVTKETELDDIASRVGRALDLARARRDKIRSFPAIRSVSADTRPPPVDTTTRIEGESPPIVALREQIAAAASAPDTTVLIRGESGTGKQVVARAIHRGSARGDAPLLEVDCATLGAGILESELFGHERGAFVGADAAKIGLVESAAGGSLLLDEIGELDRLAQGKLLRLLEQRRFRRVGSVVDSTADVRILATTNRELAAEVHADKFRSDLYYRLRVFVIEVPPLRERGDDILTLADTFIDELSVEFDREGVRLSRDARARLRTYSFPGNVRELRAMLEQAIVRLRGDAEIDTELLFPTDLPPKPRRGRPRTEISAEEAARIRESMVRHFGNQSKAARELGISRFTLKRRLQQLNDEE